MLPAAAKAEADAAADIRDSAVANLAQLDSLVDKTLYTADTYAVYREAYDEFKALVLDDGATANQLRSARSAVTKAQGTVTYTKTGGSKYLTVQKSTGKIVVAKGTPKGTYKIKVKVKAAGNKNYKAKTKTVTVTVKVK